VKYGLVKKLPDGKGNSHGVFEEHRRKLAGLDWRLAESIRLGVLASITMPNFGMYFPGDDHEISLASHQSSVIPRKKQ
jgi:hypothetical protein